MQHINGYLAAKNGRGVGPEIRGYEVQLVWEKGRRNGGRSGLVQVPVNNPGQIQQKLSGYFLEHWEGTEGLGPAGKDIATEGGRYPGVRNILSGGVTSGPFVQLGVVGQVGGNDEDDGGKLCSIPKEDHGEEGADNHRRYVGNTGGWRGV